MSSVTMIRKRNLSNLSILIPSKKRADKKYSNRLLTDPTKYRYQRIERQ